jgi:acetoin utilization protein AcuC
MAVHAYYHPELTMFDYGPDHPFKGERFGEFLTKMEDYGLDRYVHFFDPMPATDEELLKVHTQDYLDKVRALEKVKGFLSPDTQVMPGMFDAAKLICGCALSAARDLLSHKHTKALSLGGFHHAGKDYGEGFCIFNDVALAAHTAIEEFGLERVLILDTDAHQGNGTEDIFYHDPDILFISIHQDPRTLYPGRGFVAQMGDGAGKGYNINIPMPPFSTDDHYNYMYSHIIRPIVRDFNPQLVIRNGGSDPYFADELTNLHLSSQGLTDLGRWGREVSEITCNKLLDLTVSGYGKWVTDGWMAIIKGALHADEVKVEYGPPVPSWDMMENIHIKTQVVDVAIDIKETFEEYYPSLED